jgi:hypothetical protein
MLKITAHWGGAAASDRLRILRYVYITVRLETTDLPVICYGSEMDIREIGQKAAGWIHLVQKQGQVASFINKMTKPSVSTKMENFLTS